MKSLLAALLLTTTIAFADDFKPDDVKSVPTIGAVELTKGSKAEELTGKIIKLRYTSRSNDPLKTVDGLSMGRISEDVKTRGQAASMAIDAKFPDEGKPWYEKISEVYGSPAKFIYAKVLGKVDSEVRVQILGREIRNATTKPEFVW